jgi:GT2 family glycosyltransferase
MTGAPETDLTRGFLPLSVVENLDPTAVGLVDLERSLTPVSPEGRPLSAVPRDSLLLVRLHGDPLAVIHIQRPLAELDDEELAAEIWRLIGDDVGGHVDVHRCAEITRRAEDLSGGRLAAGDGCPAQRVPNEGTSAVVILSTIGENLKQLERSLRSILGQRRPNFEVIVVDNRPQTAQALEVVRSVAPGDPRVRYVAEWRTGLSVARNRGISETEAELVAFTDDDILADPDWLGWLLAPLQEPGVAAACGMILPLALETEAQKRFERYLGFSKGVRRRSHDLATGRTAGLPLYPFLSDVFGSGASMALRRADLIATGGFDTALGAGSPARAGEETDVFSAAILRGERIVYEPRSLCWHEHAPGGDAIREQIFGYGAGVGALVTKALTSDRRFYRAAASKSVLGLLGRKAPGHLPASNGAFKPPEELLRARREGIVRGPLLYARGVRRSRRMGLGDVIRGG